MGYKAQAGVNLDIETLAYIDACKEREGTSRSDIIEKAVALYRAEKEKSAEQADKKGA